LVAIIDWYSRKVLAWRLSNTLDSGFYVDCLYIAFGRDQHNQPLMESFP
jgi:hypothetical protein